MPLETGRRPLSPGEEIELAELRTRMAELDECERCFDPETDPKPPGTEEDPILGVDGRPIDIQRDSPPAEADLSVDLSFQELDEVDL